MVWFRKILPIFFSAAIAFTISATQAQYNLSDHEGLDMLERCKSEGAIELVVSLMKDNRKEWDEAMQKIVTADWRWIEASACLSHGVFFGAEALDRNGGNGDYAWATLTESWPQALLNNPEELLKQSHEISLALMCSFPLYLVDHRDEPKEKADEFLEQALAALERVDEDYLRASKEACKTYLKFDHERYVTALEEYKKPH